MTTISTESDLVTLINVFTVAPERQQELLDVLIEATEQVMRFQPGFVSANLHKSLDGQHVANYAQWRSVEDFEAMLANPEAGEHMRRCVDTATEVRPGLYRVAFVDQYDTESWATPGRERDLARLAVAAPARSRSLER
jgi:heme-degrading monooxygenase HmoA